MDSGDGNTMGGILIYMTSDLARILRNWKVVTIPTELLCLAEIVLRQFLELLMLRLRYQSRLLNPS